MVTDPLVPGVDFGPKLQIKSRGMNVPSSADIVFQLVNKFFVITNPENWEHYSDTQDTKWDPSFAPAPIMTFGADGPELAQAVVAAARGQAVLSGPMLRQLRRGLRTDDPAQPLTSREREVRSLMEQGLPDKIIAERLMLSVKTIEKHAGAVLRKTGARNRTELAARVSRPAQPAR